MQPLLTYNSRHFIFTYISLATPTTSVGIFFIGQSGIHDGQSGIHDLQWQTFHILVCGVYPFYPY